ncbi:Bacteriocin-protection, YdeI or OmpD-Associated [uncultured archaeon]|nr:Bacteriocin-protection, YdeI or OmpD-Associated [uncultured archaeon]
MKKRMAAEPQVLSFGSRAEWRAWLGRNYGKQEGIWLRVYKKGAGVKTVTHPEALDEALCFGWIDGQGRPCDSASWLVRFTPRRAKSIWSVRNTERAERLAKEKRMRQPGLLEIEKAKKDGRWGRAYLPSSAMETPKDFLEEIAKDKVAFEFFKGLNRANTYAIAWRLHTARTPEIRAKRMEALLQKMKAKQKLH